MSSSALQQGSVIGIIGGGQLGKMLCLAAAELGYKTCVYSDTPDCCAFDVATHRIIAKYDNEESIRRFVEKTSVITFEFENIPVSMFDLIKKHKGKVYPGREALQVSQDRRKEKEVAKKLGINTPCFWIIEEGGDIPEKEISYPVILKTARNGYDGRGQKRVSSRHELIRAWKKLGRVPCVAEEVIDFQYELSVILARNSRGEVKAYRPFNNLHENGILHVTNWHDPFDSQIEEDAQGIAKAIACELNIVGLLAVEMFLTRDDKIIFNEIAPRPHNSGHVTIDAAQTSQFEQHIRAIAGLPLGNPAQTVRFAQMMNILHDLNFVEVALVSPFAKIHLYGKKPRLGRKLGHVTFLRKMTDTGVA